MPQIITTFKPLNGGWFRCNQTGKRMRRGQVDTYRRTRAGANRFNILEPPKPSIQPTVQPQSTLRRANIDSSGCVLCPHCSQWHHPVYVKVGEMECRGCGKRFIAVSLPAQNLPRAQIDGDGDTICPHCGRWNFGVSPGEKSCGKCYKMFIAYR